MLLEKSSNPQCKSKFLSVGTVDALVRRSVQIISPVCIQTLNQWDSCVCKTYPSRLFLLGVRVCLQDKLQTKNKLKPKPSLLWNVVWNLILEEWVYIKKGKMTKKFTKTIASKHCVDKYNLSQYFSGTSTCIVILPLFLNHGNVRLLCLLIFL